MDTLTKKALTALRRDPRLRSVIARVGPPRFHEYSREDLLHNLLEAIVAQQLSSRVATVIFGRLKALDPGRFPDPKRLLRHSDETLKAVGLSRAKMAAVRDLCDAVLTGRVDLDGLEHMADDEALDTLVQVRGIGDWTAHMALIFSLRRPDVWPTGDLALRKSLRDLLRLGTVPTAAQAEPLGDRWRPYRSYACWYLWQMNDG